MNQDLRDRPVFICGHPKAGTSLVRSILDSHPQLVVYPEETIFFRRFFPRAAGKSLDEKLKLAEDLLIQIFTWNIQAPPDTQEGYPDRDYSAISFDEVRAQMRELASSQFNSDGDLLSAAVVAFGLVSGQVNQNTAWWVEKSPYNEYYTEKIFEWWPQARCLHIVRDPRDNFVSYRRKHPDWQPEFFAFNWQRSTQAGFRNQSVYGQERYRMLRYEDLTRSPETVLMEMTAFLGIAWDDALSIPTRAGEQWQGNSMFANRFQAISAAPIARWKERLEGGSVAKIEWITRSSLQKLGYEISIPAPSLSTRCQVAFWPIRRRLAPTSRGNKNTGGSSNLDS